MADIDISKVINVIMENPKLLDEIKNLAAKENLADESKTAAQPIEEEVHTAPPIPEVSTRTKSKRTELLDALKPYISDERKKAIESFVTIAEILEVMRAK